MRGALHVRFVENRIFPRHAGRRIVSPVESRIDDAGAQSPPGSKIPVIGKDAVQFPGIRINEQAPRVEAVPRTGRAVNPVGVAQAGRGAGQVAVPDLIRACGQGERAHGVALPEAELDALEAAGLVALPQARRTIRVVRPVEVRGDAGKWISIIAMALCGVVFIIQKDDISGGFKMLLSVVFAISFIAFAAAIVNSVFTFSGALVA